MFAGQSGVSSILVVKLLFSRKLSFLSLKEVSRVLLAADSEKRAQNIEFRPKTGKNFKKPEIFEESNSYRK